MDIKKYKNDGWGLSKKCFLDIENILNKFDNPNIVEFGSGMSTKFLIDYLNENNKDGKIISFDDNEKFASKENDDKLTLHIRKLVECNTHDFNQMFLNGSYSKDKFKIRTIPPHTRQENCFYDIEENDFDSNIDLMILDGSHGNGRSIGFLHMKKYITKGSYVVIDDFNHYDFVERFKMIFPNSKLYSEADGGRINQWVTGGVYKIFEIL